MKIREANQEDLEELRKLFRGLVRYESRYDESRKTNMEKEVGKFERRFRNKRNYACFVAEDKGKIIGFADCHTYDIFKMNRKAGYARNIFIKPKYRQKGIGRAFVKGRIEKIMRENRLPVLVLDVYPKNKPAIAAWKQMGFSQVKIHGKFLRMQKSL